MTDVTLRHALRPGDIGDVIRLHGVVYGVERGWDERFEGYVAETIAPFALGHDPERERLWLAESDGVLLGSIAILASRRSASTAQLRWFVVSGPARGRGIGSRLLDTALDFCRATGRTHVFLWTAAGLEAARRLYERRGFVRTESVLGTPWASDVTAERYDRTSG